MDQMKLKVIRRIRNAADGKVLMPGDTVKVENPSPNWFHYWRKRLADGDVEVCLASKPVAKAEKKPKSKKKDADA